MRRYRAVHGWTFFALALVLSAPARAESPEPRKTRQQAPLSAQQKAEALFAAGSKLYQQWQFVHAEQKYREALTHWEHPVIYLYLSRTLEKQGHLESAYETLQQALHQTPELLSSDDTQVAAELRRNLEARLAQIEVHCADSGAEVLLDGAPWFTATGPQRKMIRPGQHVIIARKAGYFPVTEVATLLPGKQTRVEVRLSVDEVRIERRWRQMTPWMVVTGGVTTSLIGGLFLRQAMSHYANFEETISACEPPVCLQVPIQHREEGAWRNAVGTGMLVAGSAAVVIGLVGVLLNQPYSYRSEPKGGTKLDFAPLAFGDGTGISAQISF